MIDYTLRTDNGDLAYWSMYSIAVHNMICYQGKTYTVTGVCHCDKGIILTVKEHNQ